MKKEKFGLLLKVIRSGLSLVLCVVAIAFCIEGIAYFSKPVPFYYYYDDDVTWVDTKTAQGDFDYTAHKYYGGDAYTGIQQAAADTANGVQDVENQTVVVANNIDAMNDNLKEVNQEMSARLQILQKYLRSFFRPVLWCVLIVFLLLVVHSLFALLQEVFALCAYLKEEKKQRLETVNCSDPFIAISPDEVAEQSSEAATADR